MGLTFRRTTHQKGNIMQIHISGKGLEIGEAFHIHADNRLEQIVSKYIDRISQANVVVSKQGKRFRVDMHAHLGTHAGLTIKSTGESEDIYAAFDESLEHTEKQLRRYKRRLTNHQKAPMGAMPPVVKARKVVLPPNVGEDDQNEAIDSGIVIAEKATEIQTLTVSEAVMQMDLQDLPALLFFNSAHGQLNVVYRRKDGNISWVDPQLQPVVVKASKSA